MAKRHTKSVHVQAQSLGLRDSCEYWYCDSDGMTVFQSLAEQLGLVGQEVISVRLDDHEAGAGVSGSLLQPIASPTAPQ